MSAKYQSPYTYGYLVAAWYFLNIARRQEGISAGVAISLVRKRSVMGGTIPAQQGLDLCIKYGLLEVVSGQLVITQFTKDELLPLCLQDEINVAISRALIKVILSRRDYDWLILHDPDANIFKQNLKEAEPEWTSLLENAKLFDFNDPLVHSWWERLLSKYEDLKDALNKAIGNVGEKLTYQLELKRVAADGLTPPKFFVKWASQISDKFGFDVQSVRGQYFLSNFAARDKIQIEVKSMQADDSSHFRFYISKPEWIKALDNMESYFFYCWTGVNVDKETAIDGPYIISAATLKNQIPLDRGDICEWSQCRCLLDLRNYEILVVK